jgi:quinoprotein glucose dehydrogenase
MIAFRIGVVCAAIFAQTAGAVPADSPAAAAAGSAGVADGRNAIQSFSHDPGLKIVLFAAEPLLKNPVAFTPDEKGRWFIAETYRQEKGVEDNRAHANWLNDDIASRTVEDRLAMINKFYRDPKKFAEKFTTEQERVVRIEDTNGDGVADKQTIFADGFREPLDGTGAGVIARGADVWWTCIPHLWHFRDADGDGVAEVKEKLLSGFGVKYAFRGHDMHGLRFGPDGKLYFSIGDRGINVRAKEGRQFVEPDTGSVMRCNPDGTGFEVFATGLRNPQELAFDEFGNLFTADNNSDAGDQARFIQIVEDGDCGWRMTYQYLPDRGPWNREKLWDAKEAPQAKYLIPPIANISSGPSGLTYNPGTGLSDKYRARFFLSDFRGGAAASVVHEIALKSAGASFELTARDFLKGVLTTDVEFGADGGLYVLDWVESWGGVNKGRIYKITDPAANTGLQAETEKLIAEGMSKRPVLELVQLLSHSDMRVRMSAQFALAEQGAAVAGSVSAVAGDRKANQLARLHAIWAIGQIAGKDAKAIETVLPLLADPDAEVRAQSAKVLGSRRFAAAGDQLVALLKDPSARVRFFAAQSLGKIAHKPAVDALFAALAENNDRDPILRHGCVMGLRGCASSEQLAARASDPSPAVRTGAVLALRRLRSVQTAAFLKDGNEGVRLEAARAIHDAPIDEALPALAALLADQTQKNAHLLSRVINAHYRVGTAEDARALAAFAAQKTAPESARREALDALADWGQPDAKDRVLNLWRPLPNRPGTDAAKAAKEIIAGVLKESPASVQEAGAKLAGKLGISEAGEALLHLAVDAKAGNGARVAAIQALVVLKDSHLLQAAQAAARAKSARVRNEGLQALANTDPVAAVKAIAEILAGGEVLEKQGALLALGKMQTPAAFTLLATWLDRLIAGQVPAEIQLDLYDAAKKIDKPEIKERLAKYEASFPKNDPLAPYKIALVGGNAERGRRIFREKAEVQCLRCHKCEIGDSVVGPDLTKIGAQKDRAYLLESIVFPNAKIADGFQTVTLMLKDNNAVVGRFMGEEGGQVKLESLDAQGKPQPVRVPIANIAERLNAPSPMPENLRDFLSKRELRDLVEYLATRK